MMKKQGLVKGWQDDMTATKTSEEWSITWTYLTDNKEDISTIPSYCPFKLFTRVPLYDRSVKYDAGIYEISVVYQQPKQDVDPETGQPTDPTQDELTNEEEEKQYWTYSRSINVKPLLEHPNFKTVFADETAQKCLEYITTGRADLTSLRVGEPLKRFSPHDQDFPDNVVLTQQVMNYLEYWQYGLDSYYDAFSSYDLTGRMDGVLQSLITKTGKPFVLSSSQESIDQYGDKQTTSSYTTFFEEGILTFD